MSAHPSPSPAPRALPSASQRAAPRQSSFDELGEPLHSVTFVVVDLETTGGSPHDASITEIGAVKVRGGEVLGEFQTLVRPDTAIPAFISVLTGITDAMVAQAPRIEIALPEFLDFAGDSVLVAHNAPFDIGFLKAATAACGRPWPTLAVLDTAKLARRVLRRDEVRNCKLSTLARHFRATTEPNHRALADARATVDVLHGLIERVGTEGVQSFEELVTYSARVSTAQRRKRHLAEGLPRSPGVYVFEDASGRPLYIGKSLDLRARVRSYFTASETRSRMGEMVGLAESVRHIPCATALEAEVRELRLIGEHKPRYNRRSRFPERALWVKLTVEAFPRLSVVREVRGDGATYLGPFAGRRAAEQAVAAVHEAFPIRQCTGKLSPSRPVNPCALAELGRCGAPCDGSETVDDYARHVEAVRQALIADPTTLVAAVQRRIDRMAAEQRYEEAAAHRDRVAAFVRIAARSQRITALAACPEIVAARPADDGGWEVALVRRARLAGTVHTSPGCDPWPDLEALVATGEHVMAGPAPAASAEETECVLRWLDGRGTRLVRIDGTWASPVRGAASLTDRFVVRPLPASGSETGARALGRPHQHP
jgi:DNA polymerase III subunit epsilon